MLAYAFQVLNEQGYRFVDTEEFSNTADLLSAILSKGISMQIKRGLTKGYIENKESIPEVRGKIDISDSIKSNVFMNKQIVCTYDEFSKNIYMHQILKATMKVLIKADITKQRKKELSKLLLYFQDVDDIDVRNIKWTMQFQRNNQTYQMLIAICNLIVKGLLQTQSDGTMKLMNFLDEQRMSHLYEKFILEYYRKEFPVLKVNASQIPWQLDDDENEALPIMQTDVTLINQWKTLIIDAKYYSHSMQYQYDRATIHSANLYQIFTYVKNKEVSLSNEKHIVSGMLLYAKTDENVQPKNEYNMSGNKIAVETLDLSQDFNGVKEQLNHFVEMYLAV